MPISFGVTRWSDITEEALVAIQEHAALKAREPIYWDERLAIEGGSSFGIPYSVAGTVGVVLENLCDVRGWEHLYFVPYAFDFDLCDQFPPPVEFWKDELHPAGWNESLTVVDAVWVHTRWLGSITEEYYREAERRAGSFNEAHEARRDKSTGDIVVPAGDWEFYDIAYHYVEFGLIRALGRGIDEGLPVVVYP